MAQEPKSSQDQRVLPQAGGTPMFPLPLASRIPNSPSLPSISQPSASTSTVAAAPSQLVNVLLRNPLPQPNQPSVEALAKLGIKVRDFAYESTLPPIAPVRRLPRQVQPGPRPLKRAKQDQDEADDNPFVQRSPPRAGPSNFMGGQGDAPKKSTLDRKPTEPAIHNDNFPARARGFRDLSLYDPSSQVQFPAGITSQQIDDTSSSQSQPPLQYFESQDSEPYVDTPPVTPNGSLQWPVIDNTAMPASQLDTESQTTVPELISYSQLGFSQIDELSQKEASPTPTDRSSPLSEPPPSLLLIHEPSISGPSIIPSTRTLSPLPAQTPQSARVADPSFSPSLRSPAPSPSPRYYLRKRPAVSPPQTPTRPRSRVRPTHPRAASPHPPPHPPPFSVQSAHARSKSRNRKGSPRSRTIRKGPTGTHGKDGSMLVG